MIKSVSDFLDMAYVPEVVKARRSAVRAFARFCLRFDFQFFPATEAVLLEYAAFLANSGLKASTISKYLSTIGTYNKLHGADISVNSFRLSLMMRGIKRSQDLQPASKSPLTPVELRLMRATLDWNSSQDRTFWACLVIGFWTFLRGGNLIPKSAADFNSGRHLSALNMSVDPESGVLSFNLKRTKTIQFNERRLIIPLVPLGNDLCPIQALRDMWELCPLQDNGSLFIYREGGAYKTLLHPKLNELIKRAAVDAGLDPKLFSSHSLRKGGTSVALLSGADELLVKAQGDWISNAYRRYITFSMSQRLSVPYSIAKAMNSDGFEARCKSLAIPMAAALYDLGP